MAQKDEDTLSIYLASDCPQDPQRALRSISVSGDHVGHSNYDVVKGSDFYEPTYQTSPFTIEEYSHLPKNIKYETEFSALLQKDKYQCWFFGIAGLPDGRSVLLDYSNNKLKVFNKHFKPTIDKELTGSCGGLCWMSGDRVAVTCNQGIQFYTVKQNSITKDKYIDLGSECDGISFDTAIFCVSCNLFKTTAGIKLLDAQCVEKHVIKEKDAGKNVTFSAFLQVHYIRECLYVSDWGKTKRVVALSLTGCVLWSCAVGGLPRGLTLIDNGTLIVLNLFRKVMHQINTEDGRQIQIMSMEEMNVSQGSFISQLANNRLIITQLGSNGCVVLKQKGLF